MLGFAAIAELALAEIPGLSAGGAPVPTTVFGAYVGIVGPPQISAIIGTPIGVGASARVSIAIVST